MHKLKSPIFMKLLREPSSNLNSEHLSTWVHDLPSINLYCGWHPGWVNSKPWTSSQELHWRPDVWPCIVHPYLTINSLLHTYTCLLLPPKKGSLSDKTQSCLRVIVLPSPRCLSDAKLQTQLDWTTAYVTNIMIAQIHT